MQSAINRLALFQFLTVFYCILVVGVILKARFGSPSPVIFATQLRDYGFLLLLLPATWLIWASISANRPRAGTGNLPPILVSGVVLLGLLVFLAFVGTFSAISTGTLIQAASAPRASFNNPE